MELFSFLQQRWKSLFGADFVSCSRDLTSTYFECDPPEAGKRRFGYSRDKRSDCVQVVIALVVTPDGFCCRSPMRLWRATPRTKTERCATSSRGSKLNMGKARRTWVMDRGIPTEAGHWPRCAARPRRRSSIWWGMPRGRLGQLEQDFLTKPWD